MLYRLTMHTHMRKGHACGKKLLKCMPVAMHLRGHLHMYLHLYLCLYL